MERGDRAALATFYATGALDAGASLTLGEATAQHARVRRLAAGDRIRLTDGAGTQAIADIVRLTKGALQVEVRETHPVPAPPPLCVFVPIADRDRMLWLAEKCAELSVTAWHPVRFRRSASVSPRGEGDAFRRKVEARMVAALEQSAGAWLPRVEAERSLDEVLAWRDVNSTSRYVLERESRLLVHERPSGPADVMLGPEGGIEPSELECIVNGHGWRPVSLGETTLRFETAGVVAVGILRGLLGG